MAIKKEKVFRTQASMNAESAARAVVGPFLASRGFDVLSETRKVTGTAQRQSLEVLTPSGERRQVRIKLCWRRGHDRGPNEHKYSAAQLIARVRNHDWEGALESQRAKDAREGVTHLLIVQHDGTISPSAAEDFGVVYAALMPRDDVHRIWAEQRAVADELLARRALGRMTKNPVVNGDSPTLWLQEDRYPEGHRYPDVLWNWPSVESLVSLPKVDAPPASGGGFGLGAAIVPDDSWDDLLGQPADIGRDAADRRLIERRSGVPRDPAVRRAVLERAKGGCERPSCDARRDFPGFLDVHHILGVEKSDRPWTCVALCPNCHREAHFSPRAEEIGRELDAVAARYRAEPPELL